MNFLAGIWATSKPLHWTGTEVALVGSGLVFATALMSLMLGQLNQRRQSRNALAAEKLRIEASCEIEERRISAAAEAETRRWLRNELREELARVLSGVDALLGAWEEVADARAKWIRELSLDLVREAAAEAEQASNAAWQAACRQWDQLDLTLAGIELLGSPALIDAAADLHRSFESMRHHFRGASGDSDPIGAFRHDSGIVRDARLRLVDSARREIGLAPLATASAPSSP